MIKFHYFTWPVALMLYQGLPVGGPPGEEIRCCHVYSDVGVDELVRWAQDHRVPVQWLRGEVARLPWFDLWGDWLDLCRIGVAHTVFLEDVCNVLD